MTPSRHRESIAGTDCNGERPAIGLDQRRPIDLLATPAGAKIVEDFLDRLEFGVYA
jgi:putative toxin-antitoxin system antitoxin component (TIGR02293 family)